MRSNRKVYASYSATDKKDHKLLSTHIDGWAIKGSINFQIAEGEDARQQLHHVAPFFKQGSAVVLHRQAVHLNRIKKDL